MKIINTTPHEIRFLETDGSIFTVKTCGIIISAHPVETPAGERNGIAFVRTAFVADEENTAALSRLEAKNPDSLIVGSIIAAQAFPGRVLALTPAPGFERMPVAERLMSATKFTTFKPTKCQQLTFGSFKAGKRSLTGGFVPSRKSRFSC